MLYLKLVKQSGAPDAVARGVAIGFFIGLIIPMGGQTVLAVALAFILRASKLPAMACTWISNPWTVIFLYPFQCYIGSKVIGGDLTFSSVSDIFAKFMKDPSFGAFTDLGRDIVLPFFIGGAMLAVPVALISYFATYGMIVSYNKRADAKRFKRLSALAERKRRNDAAETPDSK